MWGCGILGNLALVLRGNGVRRGRQWALVTSTRDCEPRMAGSSCLGCHRESQGASEALTLTFEGPEVPAAQSGGGDTLGRGKAISRWLAVLLWDLRCASEQSWGVGTHQMGSETFVKYMELGQGVQPGHPSFPPLPLGLQCRSMKPQNRDRC